MPLRVLLPGAELRSATWVFCAEDRLPASPFPGLLVLVFGQVKVREEKPLIRFGGQPLFVIIKSL